MKALRFHKTGDLQELKIEDVSMPEPKEDEVLVQIKAASINPADIKNVMGAMKGRTTLPRTPGRDFAGIVVKGAKHLEGKPVFGSCPVGFSSDGVQAEYAILPADGVLLKPENISFEACAAIGIPYITAWAALEAAELIPNELVLITGVNGAVGSVAAAIAKYKGARVAGTIRNASEKRDNAPVDIWINLEQDTIENKVNISLDTVGGPLFQLCIHSLVNKGRHIVIASQEPKVEFELVDFYRRQAKIIGLDTLQFTAKESATILLHVLELIKAGHIKPPTPKSVPLTDAPQAYRQIQAGELKGKVVITP
jgi:NADPH:quinone reductase-like Zn-dependent oxidoreductase